MTVSQLQVKLVSDQDQPPVNTNDKELDTLYQQVQWGVNSATHSTTFQGLQG
jgi:hypothetical protein